MKDIFIKNARATWPHVYEPGTDLSGRKQWSVDLRIDEKQYKEIRAMMPELIKEAQNASRPKFKGKAPVEVLKSMNPQNIAVRESVDKFTDEKFYLVRAKRNVLMADGSTQKAPVCYGANPNNGPTRPGDDQAIVNGCTVNAKIAMYCYENSMSKGIGCDLIALQYAGKGEPMGGGTRVASPEEFDDLGDVDGSAEHFESVAGASDLADW